MSLCYLLCPHVCLLLGFRTDATPLKQTTTPVAVTTTTTTTVAHRIDDDDDGLSYSSTEHDISAAHDDKLVTRSPNVAATPLLPDVNLTGPSGKLAEFFVFLTTFLCLKCINIYRRCTNRVISSYARESAVLTAAVLTFMSVRVQRLFLEIN